MSNPGRCLSGSDPIVIRYLLLETRIAVHPGVWIAPGLLLVLRLLGVIQPEGWLAPLEIVYPIIYPVLAHHLLEQEKRWRTLEVLAASPRCGASALVVRYLLMTLPLFAVAAVVSHPKHWPLLLASGIGLGAIALLVGLLWEEEIGLTVALAWWSTSFAASMTGSEVLSHPVVSWFLCILLRSSLTPEEILVRKWAQIGAAILLLAACALATNGHPHTRPRR